MIAFHRAVVATVVLIRRCLEVLQVLVRGRVVVMSTVASPLRVGEIMRLIGAGLAHTGGGALLHASAVVGHTVGLVAAQRRVIVERRVLLYLRLAANGVQSCRSEVLALSDRSL